MPRQSRTGLAGNFDITLEWTPDDRRPMPLPPPVEILVIDRAEKPPEN